MITVFTVCSANYLAQAKTLGQSLHQHNPDYHFVIGLVDRISPELDPALKTTLLPEARVWSREQRA